MDAGWCPRRHRGSGANDRCAQPASLGVGWCSTQVVWGTAAARISLSWANPFPRIGAWKLAVGRDQCSSGAQKWCESGSWHTRHANAAREHNGVWLGDRGYHRYGGNGLASPAFERVVSRWRLGPRRHGRPQATERQSTGHRRLRSCSLRRAVASSLRASWSPRLPRLR